MFMEFSGLTAATLSRKSSSDKTLNCPFIKRKFQSLVILFHFIHYLLMAVERLSLIVVMRPTLCFSAGASHRGGLFCYGAWALEHGLQQLWSTTLVAPWHVDLPGPGIEPVSPALAGGLPTLDHLGSPEMPFWRSIYSASWVRTPCKTEFS